MKSFGLTHSILGLIGCHHGAEVDVHLLGWRGYHLAELDVIVGLNWMSSWG